MFPQQTQQSKKLASPEVAVAAAPVRKCGNLLVVSERIS